MQRNVRDDAPRRGGDLPPPGTRVRSIAAGALLGGGGFAAASLAGIAGVHLAGQTAGLQVRADDHPRVWLGNTGNTGDGAGLHASDRRPLACGDIDLWGNDIEHAAGTYTVVSEEPTGHDQKLLTGAWRYARRSEGRQVLAVLPGPALVNAAQAAGATPHGDRGLRFAVRLKHADVDDQRHFWIAACPAAPPPPAPAAAVAAAHVTRPAAVPSTGVGDRELGGLVLVTAGGGCLGAAVAGRRDRRTGATAGGAAMGRTAARPRQGRAAAAPAAVRTCADAAATLPGRRLAVAAVAVVLTGAVAGPGRDATVGVARTLLTRAERLVAPQPPPVRVVPVDVGDGTSRGADPELSDLGYPFPGGAARRR